MEMLKTLKNIKMKLWKNFAFAVVLTVLITSCSNYRFVTQSDIIYLEEGQDATSIFTNYDADIIRLQFTTITPRFHYNKPYYYYWHTRPLWLDYDFIYDPWHFGYYSFFYRPWNYWQYWMRPWQWNRPWKDNMFDGPFNNPNYNVVYNNSRRKSSSIETTIVSNKAKPRIKPIIIIPKVKPLNNSYKPISVPLFKPSNNYKPSNNSYKPSNSRPSYNSKPTTKLTNNFNKSKRNEKN
tara:strand:- start:478 stop:1188 length:711 start_codon:yes stop_codon:yes gene_type:complete